MAGCRGSHEASGLCPVLLLFYSLDSAGTMAARGPAFRGKSSCRKSPRRVSDWSSLGHGPTLNWGMGSSGRLAHIHLGHRALRQGPRRTLQRRVGQFPESSTPCVDPPFRPLRLCACRPLSLFGMWAKRLSGHDCSVRAQALWAATNLAVNPCCAPTGCVT